MAHRAFSDEQMEAAAQAQLSDGLTSREVAERAAAGTLREGLEPFAVSESTVRGWRARIVREGRADPEDVGDELAGVAGSTVRRLAALIDRVVAAEEAKKDAGEIDLERVRQAVLVAERIGKAARANGQPGRRRPAVATPEPAEDWLASVAAMAGGSEEDDA